MLQHARHVLAVQRAQQHLARRAGEARLLQQRRREPRQGQVEAHAGQAECGQRLRPDQHHLGIRGQAVAADQLDPGLRNLPVRRDLAALHAQALPGVAQPQRARGGAQPGGRDTGNLRRDVGAEPHHAMGVRIHHAEDLVRRGPAQFGEQTVLELHQRRLDPLVAMRGERGHHTLDGGGLRLRIRRQHVPQTSGQQGRVRGRIDQGLGHDCGYTIAMRGAKPAPVSAGAV